MNDNRDALLMLQLAMERQRQERNVELRTMPLSSFATEIRTAIAVNLAYREIDVRGLEWNEVIRRVAELYEKDLMFARRVYALTAELMQAIYARYEGK